MLFHFLSIGFGGGSFSFEIMGIEKDSDLVRCLFGIGYNKEEKVIGLDLFWMYFPFNF